MFRVSDPQKAYLLAIARRTIAAELGLDTAPLPPTPEPFADRCGAFVTLKEDGALRGCIGTMTSDSPLPELIAEMARSSAFSDPRFPSVTADEFSQLEIELSLLSPLAQIRAFDEVVPGTHGLYIAGRGHSGVLLPQVAAERDWDRTTFLEQTCRKAGLPTDAYLSSDVAVSVFSAVLCSEPQLG